MWSWGVCVGMGIGREVPGKVTRKQQAWEANRREAEHWSSTELTETLRTLQRHGWA